MNELQDIPLWLWVCIALAVLLQGTFLFRDAKKRGRRAWFWGLWGMTTVPSPVVVYLLIVILPDRRRRKKPV